MGRLIAGAPSARIPWASAAAAVRSSWRRSAAMPSRGAGWAAARSTKTPAAASISTTQHAAGARYGRIEASILDPVPVVSRQPFMDHPAEGTESRNDGTRRAHVRPQARLVARGDAGGCSVCAPRCRDWRVRRTRGRDSCPIAGLGTSGHGRGRRRSLDRLPGAASSRRAIGRGLAAR